MGVLLLEVSPSHVMLIRMIPCIVDIFLIVWFVIWSISSYPVDVSIVSSFVVHNYTESAGVQGTGSTSLRPFKTSEYLASTLDNVPASSGVSRCVYTPLGV